MAGRRRRDDDGNGGEAGQEEEERMRAYYDSQAPIARGVFVKKVKLGRRLVDYYDFVESENQAGASPPARADGNQQLGRRNRRRVRGGAPPAAAGQQNENGASSAAAVAGGGEGVGGHIAMAAAAAVGGGGGLINIRDQNNNNVAGAPPSGSHEVQAAAAAAAGGGGGGGDMEEGEVIGDRPIMPVASAVGPGGGAAGDGDGRWVIRKKLSQSDVNGSSRLLLLNEEVVKHVLKYIEESEISKEGKEVRVWDEDEHVEYTMRLARWNSSGSYVFKDGWKCKIVETRKLKKDDTVGFYWDPIMSRFVFSVLEVAPPVEAGHNKQQLELR